MVLHVTESASKFLAHEGFEPAYGARPLKRVIQRRLEDPIALAVLQGRYRDGDTITIDVDKRSLDVDLTVAEIDERVAAYIPPANPDRTGVLAKYADQVGSASEGAVTLVDEPR